MKTGGWWVLWGSFAAAAAVSWSCGGDLCDGVKCRDGRSCDPTDGICKKKDAANACRPACADPTPVCDELKECKVCTATAGCSGDTPLCDTSTRLGACVQCLMDGDCTAGTTCDAVTHSC